MTLINVQPMTMQNGDRVTSYTNTVGPAQETFTFLTAQETVILRNKGSKNISYTINEQSSVLGRSESAKVTGSITSITLSSEQGTQQFEIWADEAGSTSVDNETLNNLTSQLAQNAKINKFGYNLDEGLRNYRNALADVDRNPLKIACVGDSITYGLWSSDIIKTNWAGRLRTIMQSKLGDVGIGAYPITSLGYANVTPWTFTGTWNNQNASGSMGKFMYGAAGATATITVTGTSFDLIYGKTTAGGASVSVTVDGVEKGPINCFSNTGSVYGNVLSVTGLTAGSHTVVITGAAIIEGLIGYNPISATGNKGCYVHNLGTPSATAAWLSPQASKIVSYGGGAHLYIIALGINDARNNTANFYTQMGTLISTMQSTGASVLLLPMFMTNDPSAGAIQAYPSLVQQQYQLADQYNCGLIDIYSRWGKSWNTAQIGGLMGSNTFNGNSGNDNTHPSDKGHRDIANAIAYHLVGQVS
jgi:lysophospholipase L1-like esterase